MIKQQTSTKQEFIVKLCEICSGPIYYPAGASNTVCIQCPHCGHRPCSGN